MNSKFSNQDLINATLEIYNSFDKKSYLEIPHKINIDAKNPITKKVVEEQKIEQDKSPLILTKEVKEPKPSNLLKNIFNDDEKSENSSLANEKSLEDNKQKKSIIKKNKPVKKTAKKVLPMLRLNKIIKFENSKYLLLHKIKNSDLKIIKMRSPNL